VRELFKNKELHLLVLLFTSILLNNLISSLLIILSVLYVLMSFKKENYKFSDYYFIPLILFLSMFLSLISTIDKDETIKSLIKELPLLVIPLIFARSSKIIINNKQYLLKYYSYSVIFFTFFFLIKAIINYFVIGDLKVFFYHDLVSKELNAIHVSVFVSLAFFFFLIKELKKTIDYFLIVYLFLFLILLSSKIIIFTTIIIVAIYFLFYSKSSNRMRLRNLIIIVSVVFGFLFFGKIKEKMLFEFNIKSESNIGHTVINRNEVGSNIISMKEAWSNEKFNQTDYFSGASFRVYQARIFFKFLQEEPIFWTGFGLNASYKKIEEKGIYYNVFQGNKETEGYQKKNFHNQYIQVFAELGFIGFLILATMLFINIKNAFNTKDFMHIAFAILMISLFLTESFLWRQRGVVFFTLFYCLFNFKNEVESNFKN